MGEAILETVGLTKQFGGFTAVDDVSLELRGGDVTAIIGPNGAGKTTLFDLLSGRIDPTSGEIRFEGTRLDGLDPSAVPRHGIARSFQLTNVFPGLSTFENVRLAAQRRHTDLRPGAFLSHYRTLEAAETDARAVLDRTGLSAVASEAAASLSHGRQRHLDIAVALAADPDLLLLDEPTAGMSPEETKETTDLVADVGDEVTVAIIEHDMDVVADLADRVAVMHRGRVQAVGTPDEVRDDESVQEIYLTGGAVA
ncbi:ABC transporter ATP-binding protein [Halobacteriales archaeon QS_1_68_20]|nr:MAG: ABC transporter ATP-binding protein [Halobacteriales archaeon QS_1_68_20]